MSVLSVEDMTTGASGCYYQIPTPVGTRDTEDLEGVIARAEEKFEDVFGTLPESADEGSAAAEALKYWTAAWWIRWQTLRKSPAGISAKNHHTQADAVVDKGRFRECYNAACELMGEDDMRLVPIINGIF